MAGGEGGGRREGRMRSQQSCGWTRCSTDAQTRQARLEAEQVRAEDDSLANTRFSFSNQLRPREANKKEEEEEAKKRGSGASEVAGAPVMF